MTILIIFAATPTPIQAMDIAWGCISEVADPDSCRPRRKGRCPGNVRSAKFPGRLVAFLGNNLETTFERVERCSGFPHAPAS